MKYLFLDLDGTIFKSRQKAESGIIPTFAVKNPKDTLQFIKQI